MKATPNQIKLAKDISDYILSIVNTNDLQSPSHWTLNEEAARIITEEYYPIADSHVSDNCKLENGLKEIFDNTIRTIRKVK